MSADDVDPLVAQTAAIDQMVAAAPELSRALYGTYEAHLGAGFSVSQSMNLVRDWYRWLLDQGGD